MERQHTLLLVEDEQVLRTLVAEFLRESGFRVVEAADGLEGLARFADSGPFDLALVDLNLPGCHGVEVCRGIRERRADQPILVVSAVLLSDHHAALDELGLADILTKPYHPEVLLSRIHHHLAPSSCPYDRDPYSSGAAAARLVFQAVID